MEDVAAWRQAKRTELIARRMGLGAADRQAWSVRITTHLETVFAALEPGVIGFYWATRGEYDARAFVEGLLTRDWRAALPVVVGKDRPLEYRSWMQETVMERGVLGIMVPRDGAPVLPDAILVPLVGYDGARHRLGNGGGYFDRTLAEPNPPFAIGVGFSVCRLDTIRPQPHDKPMDVIVTEAGVLR